MVVSRQTSQAIRQRLTERLAEAGDAGLVQVCQDHTTRNSWHEVKLFIPVGMAACPWRWPPDTEDPALAWGG